MREFLGFGGYQRTPEGALSWQHLGFVGLLMAAMFIFAIALGRRNRHKDEASKNRVLVAAAILIDSIELFKLSVFCLRGEGISEMRTNLPLFLCSIQLLTIPLAAFSRGRMREASLDFVFVFGLLGGLLGTFGAFQNYNAYPVLGIENVASGLTHALAGFASLYIGVSGLSSMKKKNIPVTYGILLFFIAAAAAANELLDYNYMFLRRGDGTPYDILYRLVGGSPILYPLGVVVLFILYIAGFYGVFYLYGRKTLKTA
ncbi:MAG: YwaF family protein [Oscillospiraceae bacterium]|nr:YwaF family protein [Oscillospiraceae bacterium]